MKNGFAMLSSFSRGIRRGPLCFLSLGIALLFLAAASARANTWTVNRLQDSSDGSCGATCSLRDAITAAKSDTSGNVLINFSVTGTITLTSALPAISSSMTIQGPGANGLTISGNQKYRIFDFPSGSPVVSISGLTLADGRADGGNGGAINSGAASLTITNCTFSNNVASYSLQHATSGGAIASGGKLTVTNCTFFGNRAPWSGYYDTQTQGGAIYYAHNALTVTNSTFYGNSALAGGAIYTNSGTITNSIFNRNSGSPSAIYHSGGVSQSYNLFYNNDDHGYGGLGVNGNANYDVEEDPMLLPLGSYGGPTKTLMPQAGSAAICAGDASALTSALSSLSLPSTDQRGWPVSPTVGACTNGNVDIGSVQTNYLLVTSTSGTGSGTLPGEVSLANTSGGHDIGFSPNLESNPTITLSSHLSLSSGDTLFLGPVTISGGNSTQILSLSSSGDASAILYGLTLQDGSATDGGALDNEGSGTLTVSHSTLSGNQATENGGAIENGGTGTVVVTDSTFSGNSVGNGGFGGAVHSASGTLAVTNSTFSGNQAGSSTSSGDGGAIDDAGGTLVLVDNIVSGNSAGSSGIGGVSYGGTSITENNNLFYDNGAGGDASGFDPSSNSTDVTGASADPKLAPLGNYGGTGTTQTMLPLPGSPAMCEGTTSLPSPFSLPGSDQRGFPRTTAYPGIHTTCADIGAVQARYTDMGFIYLPPGGGYIAIEHQAMTPQVENITTVPPTIAVNEQGVTWIDGVLLTLTVYDPVPSPAATGVMATTAAGAGATFSGLTVDTPGIYRITSTLKTTTLNTFIKPPHYRLLTVLSYEQADINYINTITTLTSGQVNSMDRELNKAYSMALDGKFKGAINNLEQFIAEVDDLYSSGVLTTEQANTLLAYANDAINWYKQGLL